MLYIIVHMNQQNRRPGRRWKTFIGFMIILLLAIHYGTYVIRFKDYNAPMTETDAKAVVKPTGYVYIQEHFICLRTGMGHTSWIIKREI